MKMQGKSVVVTGASSGMGDAIVRLFVAEGASVVAVARRKERLEALKESLTEAPGTIEIYPGDVSDQSICEGMIDFAVEKFGKLDVLINNAGVMDDMSPIGDATNEKYEKLWQSTCLAPSARCEKQSTSSWSKAMVVQSLTLLPLAECAPVQEQFTAHQRQP